MKPVIHYSDVQNPVTVGKRTWVRPIDHPVKAFNGGWVNTSPVRSTRPGINGPTFETGNSVYVAGETDESFPRGSVVSGLKRENAK